MCFWRTYMVRQTRERRADWLLVDIVGGQVRPGWMTYRIGRNLVPKPRRRDTGPEQRKVGSH